MKDMAFGIVAGVAGAILWAAVAYFTQYEIGWIAWGIGGLVGYAVALGNSDQTRTPTAAGIIAVVITALSITGGKYLAVQMMMPSDAELVQMVMQGLDEEEYAKSFVADAVVGEYEAAGTALEWPLDANAANRTSQADYPADVWQEAERRWSQTSEQDREAFTAARVAEARTNVEANLPAIRASVSSGGFAGSFGATDVLFFGLGMFTAFGIASRRGREAELTEEFTAALKLAMLKVMLADGTIDDDEVAVAAAVYLKVSGRAITPEAIRAEATAAQSSEADLLTSLAALEGRITEDGKKMVTRAAIMVSLADGAASPEEQQLIGKVADALGLSAEDLATVVTEFKPGEEGGAP